MAADGKTDSNRNEPAPVRKTENPLTTSSGSASASHRNKLKWFAAALPVVGLGILIGVFIPQSGIRPVVAEWLLPAVEDQADEAEHTDEEGLFEVSLAAQDTYELKIGKAKPQPYTQFIRVPAFIRERPAVSNLQASSRMQGVVRSVFVQVGQSVREGDPLVELELTGDELASAQAVLLDSVQQLSILEDEIRRLRPAAEDGGIARKNLIDKEYEERRMKSLVESKRQELLVRGLSEQDVDGIIRDRKLVRTMTLRVPNGIRPDVADQMTKLPSQVNQPFRPVSQVDDNVSAAAPDGWVYSIETMNVSPGTVVAAGEPFCDLAYHETLLVEGQAWERDLELLTHIIESGTEVSISVGDSDNPTVIDGLRVLFMDNHIDGETQTYRFYIELHNSVLAENRLSESRRFRAWRFKPGQRGHVRLPQKTWTDRLVLPADAVVEDGVDHVIFQQVAVHDHFHGSEPPHSEFRAVVVKVEYRDQYTVVVDHRGQLKARHDVVLNNADMLLRAKNESAGGGGHSHHGHEH